LGLRTNIHPGRARGAVRNSQRSGFRSLGGIYFGGLEKIFEPVQRFHRFDLQWLNDFR